MTSSPVSNNLLLYKTLLKSTSNAQAHLSNASLSNELFVQLLESALLQAEMTGDSNDSNSSIFGNLTPANFTALGLSSSLIGSGNLGGISTAITQGLSNIENENPIIDNIQSSLKNSSSLVGNSLHYQEIDANELGARLNGALQNAGDYFVEAGKKYQINPAFLAAVSMHETGNGTSNAARFKNNVAGMMGKNGLKSYDSVEKSIFDMARNLRENYLDEGKTTISTIGAKYAPVGAANDPTGLNNHWVKGVQSYFDKITKTDFS
jgi:hypothetical protein